MTTTIPQQTGPVEAEARDAAGTPHAAPPGEAPAAERERAGRGRLQVLDGLRLVAALAVLSWHWMGVQTWPAIWHGKTGTLMPLGEAVGAYGWLGVELFFLISGFVICMSCWGRPVGQFLGSRVSRLFPAYWFAVLLTSAVLYLSPERWGIDPTKPSMKRVLTNLTMAHAPMGVSDIDAVYWTLWIELRFYVIFGLVVALGLTYRRVLAFCGVWGFLSLISTSASFGPLDEIVVPDYSWFFIGGVVIYLMHRFGPNLLLWGMLGFSWLMAENRTATLMHKNTAAVGYQLSGTVAAGVVLLCYAVVVAAGLGYFDWMRWRWLTVAGALTYPLYLIHQELGFELINRLSPHLSPYATFGVSLAVMLLAAYAIHRLIERPLGARLKRGLAASFTSVRRAGAH